jgi:hypothetical protein
MFRAVNGRMAGRAAMTTGAVVSFTYEKLNGESNKYKVIVIDPARVNKHTEDSPESAKLHAYDITNLDDREFIRFLCDLDVPFKINPAEKELSIAELDSVGVYEAFKTSLKRLDRPYRTFNISKIKEIRRIALESEELGLTKGLPPVIISDDTSKRMLVERLEQGLPINDVPEIKKALRGKSKAKKVQPTSVDQSKPLQDMLKGSR